MEFKIIPLEPGKPRGWKATVNGVETEVNSLQLTNPKVGTLEYGKRPEGYDAWVFRENGGGGAVTLLYAWNGRSLFIGLLQENRSNMGDTPVLGVAGGFIDPGETWAQAQKREAEEETGVDTSKAHQLKGVPSNSNRGFFVTDPDKNEGIHSFALQLRFDQLEKIVKDGVTTDYKLKAGVVKGLKNPDNIRFFHWREAIELTPDIIARGAIAQLLAEVLP